MLDNIDELSVSVLTFACSCLCFQTCPLFPSQLSISHYWTQGKLQAKWVRYDTWYTHLGKVHCIRLPEFLIPHHNTVGLTFFPPSVIITLTPMPAKWDFCFQSKISLPFAADGWRVLFFFCRAQRSQGLGTPPRAGCSQHSADGRLMEREGNWSSIHTLRTGGNDPNFFGGICNSYLFSLLQLWLFSDFLLGNICLI